MNNNKTLQNQKNYNKPILKIKILGLENMIMHNLSNKFFIHDIYKKKNKNKDFILTYEETNLIVNYLEWFLFYLKNKKVYNPDILLNSLGYYNENYKISRIEQSNKINKLFLSELIDDLEKKKEKYTNLEEINIQKDMSDYVFIINILSQNNNKVGCKIIEKTSNPLISIIELYRNNKLEIDNNIYELKDISIPDKLNIYILYNKKPEDE